MVTLTEESFRLSSRVQPEEIESHIPAAAPPAADSMENRRLSADREAERRLAETGEILLPTTARPVLPRVEARTMYLTFDDGPSRENTDKILDVLKEKGIKATFFVIGEYVEKFPETARRIVAEGHAIGIHCYVHDYSTLYASPEAYLADFEKAYETVKKITGVEATLFRFPGGSVTNYSRGVLEEIVREMEGRGFTYFDWNVSLEDTVGGKTAEELVEYAAANTLGRKKVVLLAHDRVTATAECVEELIETFSEYRMEPLTQEVEPIQFRRFWETD